MDPQVTGSTIKRLRTEKKISQEVLAEKLGVTAKAVSKWETGRGYPDITLLEELSLALDVTVMELMSGEKIVNTNKSSNILKSKFYVCPVCGNMTISSGESMIACCGIKLPILEAEEVEEDDEEHRVILEQVEDEVFVRFEHPMTKAHYISFVAWVSGDKFEVVKFYPESSAQTRMKMRGRGVLYYYCNRDGFFKKKIGVKR